jgi:hypothetical protein
MSSDYYGALAGEVADRQAQAWQAAKIERGFLLWVDEHTRGEATLTSYEELQAAFYAGFKLAHTDVTDEWILGGPEASAPPRT